MNKQELIEKFENLLKRGYLLINMYDVLDLVKKLDEPQKVKVPQFVADWYEKHKDDLEYDIWEYILHWGKQQKSEFYEWMNHANNKPFQTLANMHQFGYEVEKEPKYTVSLKNGQPLVKSKSGNTLYFSQDITAGNYKGTRKEIEDAGFGEVFNSPLFEVEEV